MKLNSRRSQTKFLDPPLLKPVYDRRLVRVGRVSNYTLVSGKFVTAMVFHYVKARYSLGSMTFESFVYRLAKNSELSSMRPFAARVRTALRNHPSSGGGAASN